jgi:hypothetical protein
MSFIKIWILITYTMLNQLSFDTKKHEALLFEAKNSSI